MDEVKPQLDKISEAYANDNFSLVVSVFDELKKNIRILLQTCSKLQFH